MPPTLGVQFDECARNAMKSSQIHFAATPKMRFARFVSSIAVQTIWPWKRSQFLIYALEWEKQSVHSFGNQLLGIILYYIRVWYTQLQQQT